MIENLKELLLEAQSIENDKIDLLKMKEDLEARERDFAKKLAEATKPLVSTQIEMFETTNAPEWQVNLERNDKFFSTIPTDLTELSVKAKEARRHAGHDQKDAATTVNLTGSTWSRIERGVDNNYNMKTLRGVGDYIKRHHPDFIPF